jgi:DNA-binding HxlR family transcriptional regulator
VASRTYDQQCPIACGLDALGERWTLLILRELLGGARRYSDLRAELPGIATNLLADRLRELEREGLIERRELPPPAARTVYSLSDRGWEQIPPILQSIAWFGLGRLAGPGEGEKIPPLTGFLAIVMAFDRQRAGTLDASYRVTVDGRPFELAVRDGKLAAARGEPQVRLTASAADLVALRLATDPNVSARIASRLMMEGSDRAQSRFRTTFALPGA